MTKHKWAKEIHAWADGAEIESHHVSWVHAKFVLDNNPNWDDEGWEFRIADPYRELKEAAKDPKKQIRYQSESGNWGEWHGPDIWTFEYPVERYQIRDKPKPKRKVKLYQWLYRSPNGELITTTHTEFGPTYADSKRLDETMIEVEVDDE